MRNNEGTIVQYTSPPKTSTTMIEKLYALQDMRKEVEASEEEDEGEEGVATRHLSIRESKVHYKRQTNQFLMRKEAEGTLQVRKGVVGG